MWFNEMPSKSNRNISLLLFLFQTFFKTEVIVSLMLNRLEKNQQMTISEELFSQNRV